jgi:hypothetical protein
MIVSAEQRPETNGGREKKNHDHEKSFSGLYHRFLAMLNIKGSEFWSIGCWNL